MVRCPNSHENLGGLSNCRVCGLPLLDLTQEFTFLTDTLNTRAEMGRLSPEAVLVGLGRVGASLVNICKATYASPDPAVWSYLDIDTNGSHHPEPKDIFRLKLGAQTPNAGTFCGIGESVTKNDPQLSPAFRTAGLSHEDGRQVIFLASGIGGGIGSAASVLVEKCRQLNPSCHILAIVVIPGADESFHNHLNAYYGLSRLLDNEAGSTADIVMAVNYDRLKALRGVGGTGQELTTDTLMAALINLLMRNVSSQYLSEMVRINRTLGVKVVVPCLALGRSLEIFGNLNNILESAVAFPANTVAHQSVLSCHLVLRVPRGQSRSFEEETVNEQLWKLVRRHLPGVKATSSSITYSDEQHDRVEAGILLGGDLAANALFGDLSALMGFQEELQRPMSWEAYGLNPQSVKRAGDVINEYDRALDKLRGDRRINETKAV